MNPEKSELRSLSLRDPSGDLFDINDRLVRFVHRNAIHEVEGMLLSPTVDRLTKLGQWVTTFRYSDENRDALWARVGKFSRFAQADLPLALGHERLPFVSYPHEWSPAMLHIAAELTLDLAESLLAEGRGLKDATPRNILFRGPTPVFVDVLSLETRHPLDLQWTPYAQFARWFLNPLLVNKIFKLPVGELLLCRKDGVESEEVYALSSPIRRCLPPVLQLATIPTLLGRLQSKRNWQIYGSHKAKSAELAHYLLQGTFKSLRRLLKKVAPPAQASSHWTGYAESGFSYSPKERSTKLELVTHFLNQAKPLQVLDLGCNTGEYSRLAASTGASVIGIDSDEAAISESWLRAKENKLDILPLVVNIGRPTPALGWDNGEASSFLERSGGHFDAVLMLALLHHLMATDGIPLKGIARLAARLTTRYAVVEYISPQDPAFQLVARGRDFSFETREKFEREWGTLFTRLSDTQIAGSQRWLYVFEKRGFGVKTI